MLVNSAPASAQAPAPPAPLQAGFQDGFFIQTTTGDYRLLFGFVAQEDGRFAAVDGDADEGVGQAQRAQRLGRARDQGDDAPRRVR